MVTMSTSTFDAKAATWDQDPDKIGQAKHVARTITAQVPLSRWMRLLEYGAGTGLVSQELAGRVGTLTLADNSTGMREVITAKIHGGLLPPARVWGLDLEADEVPAETFEVIVTSMVMHHVRDLDRVLAGFTEMLAPGGWLCIADLDREDGSFHTHDFDGHHGFDRTELTATLSARGFTNAAAVDCGQILRDEVPYSVFLATARWPLSS